MTVLLAVEPACRQSFRAVFFPGSEEEALAAQQAENGDADPSKTEDKVFTHVVPGPSDKKKTVSLDLPGVIEEMQLEDVEEAAEAAEVAQGEKKASLEPDQPVLKSLGRKRAGH